MPQGFSYEQNETVEFASQQDNIQAGDADESSADEPTLITAGLFAGDTGHMTFEQRRTLTALIKRRYIDGSDSAEAWAQIVENEDLLRSALNDLFLTLTIDKRYQLAYAEPAQSDTLAPFPNPLKSSRTFKREETILIIYLRTVYHQQTTSGQENVFVDKNDLLDILDTLRTSKDVDLVSVTKRNENAVEELEGKLGYLQPIAEQKGRYRVSPIIASLYPLEKVKELKRQFEELTKNGPDNEPSGSQEKTDE